MLKLLLSVLLLSCCVFVGNCFSMRLSKRRDILAEVLRLLVVSEDKITYTHADLYTVFNDNFMDFTFDERFPFQSQWNDFVSLLSPNLKKDDLDVLFDVARGFGESDADSECRHLRLSEELVKKRIDDAQKAVAEKSRLYRVFGFCVGMALALLLI